MENWAGIQSLAKYLTHMLTLCTFFDHMPILNILNMGDSNNKCPHKKLILCNWIKRRQRQIQV